MKKLIVLMIFLISATVFAGEKEYCESEWNNDFRMQKYCLDSQLMAKVKVYEFVKKHGIKDENQSYQSKIFAHCVYQWELDEFDTFDWRMVMYCIDSQMKAYHSIKGD